VTKEAFEDAFKGMSDGLFSTVRKMLGDSLKDFKQSAAPETPSKKQSPAPDAGLEELTRRMDEMKLDSDFDRAVQGLDLQGKKRALARDLYGKDLPDNPADWAKEISEMFGIKPDDTQSSPAQEPSRPGAGSPAPARTGATPTKIRDWTVADRNAWLKSKGVDPSKMNLMKNKPVFKELTERYEAELAEDRVRYALVDRK